MSPNIQMEARLLVVSMAVGAGLMALYDVLRLLRLVLRHSWLATGLEDLAYWSFAGFATFYLLYQENDGALRFYVIGTVLLAMVLYDRVWSTNFFRVLKKLAGCIRIKRHGEKSSRHREGGKAVSRKSW